MKGYPKTIATKKDYENLLTMPEFKTKALADLKALSEIKDDTVTKVAAGAKEIPDVKDILTIENPNPLWKQKGFKSKAEVTELLNKKD